MKIVLDSNVLIAAFASHGLCSSIFELCVDRYAIVLSYFIFSEISDVLLQKFKIPNHMISSIIEYLENSSLVLDYAPLQESICRDKTDDEILALARGSGADYIITGDKDLLVLKEFEHTKIVKPRAFWELAKQENREK
ncbi:putative toxin-antitoxin system toxin component, PIN family [bacterium]|nr:putative toxin-antitoxin system toxin component, PIN family [bacterium]